MVKVLQAIKISAQFPPDMLVLIDPGKAAKLDIQAQRGETHTVFTATLSFERPPKVLAVLFKK